MGLKNFHRLSLYTEFVVSIDTRPRSVMYQSSFEERKPGLPATLTEDGRDEKVSV